MLVRTSHSHPLREDIGGGESRNGKICFLLLFLGGGGEWLEIGGNPGKNRRKMIEQKEISSNSVRICQVPH